MYLFKPHATTFAPITLRSANLVERLQLPSAAETVAEGLPAIEDRVTLHHAMMRLSAVVPRDARHNARLFFEDFSGVGSSIPTSIYDGKTFGASLLPVNATRLKRLIEERQRVAGRPQEAYAYATLRLSAEISTDDSALTLAYSIAVLSKKPPSFLELAAREFIKGPPTTVIFFQIVKNYGLNKPWPEALSMIGGVAVYPAIQDSDLPTILMEESMRFTRPDAKRDVYLNLANVSHCDHSPRHLKTFNTPFDGGLIRQRVDAKKDQEAAEEASRGLAWVYDELFDLFKNATQKS